MITIRDVAKTAGVSVATVSMVINGNGQKFRISEETQAKVQAAARELGYVADKRAASLRSAQSATNVLVAFVADRVPAAFFVEIMQGLDEAASRVGLETQFHLVRAGKRDAWQNMRSLAKSAAGVVMVGNLEPGDQERMRDLPVPVVHIGAGQPDQESAVVRVDNMHAGQSVAAHLLSLGHRRFALVGPNRWYIPFMERRDGIKAALQEAGLGEPLIISDPEPGLETVERLREAGVTAVVCLYDRLALGLLRAAREAGIRVPDQWSVASFDDMEYAALLSPPLTTVRIPRPEMARAGIDLLQQLVQGQLSPEPRLITPQLIVRGSTGPVRA